MLPFRGNYSEKRCMNSKPLFKLDLRAVLRITAGRPHAISMVPCKILQHAQRRSEES
jgi:hypothetical protein